MSFNWFYPGFQRSPNWGVVVGIIFLEVPLEAKLSDIMSSWLSRKPFNSLTALTKVLPLSDFFVDLPGKETS